MVLVQKEIKRVTIRPNGTEEQIRPSGIVETITPAYNTWNNIYKSGYKIQQIILEGYHNASGNGVYQYKIYQTNGGKDIGFSLKSGSNWGSTSDGSGTRYGRFYKDNPTAYSIIDYQNTWTTSTQGACRIVFKETSCIVQVGKTMNNWEYDNTMSYTSDIQDTITTIFNSSTPRIYCWGTNISNFIPKATITYIAL